MRYDLYFFIFLVAFSFNALGACKEGTKLILDYDQKNQTFSVDSPIAAQVCHWINKQENSNVKVQYFNDVELVFEHFLFFPEITIHEELTKQEKLRPHAREESFLKIVNIPVLKKDLRTFKVMDLESNSILSSGKVE